MYDGGIEKFVVTKVGDVYNYNGVYASFSDKNIKNNVIYKTKAYHNKILNQINKYKLVSYKLNKTHKDDIPIKLIGLIAQDLQKINPNLVVDVLSSASFKCKKEWLIYSDDIIDEKGKLTNKKKIDWSKVNIKTLLLNYKKEYKINHPFKKLILIKNEIDKEKSDINFIKVKYNILKVKQSILLYKLISGVKALIYENERKNKEFIALKKEVTTLKKEMKTIKDLLKKKNII